MKFHNKFERQERWSSNKIRPKVEETTRGRITKRIELGLWYSIKIVESVCPRTFYSFSCILLSMNEESHLCFCDYPRTMTTTMCLWTETHCSRNRTRRRLEREEQVIERDKEAELFMTQGGLICKKGRGRERYSSDKVMRMSLSDWIYWIYRWNIIMKKIVFFSFGMR